MSLKAEESEADRLSVRVRRDTRSAHQAAQGSGFLDRLAAGELPWEAYADLTAQHWFVYEALEAAGRTMSDDLVVSRFVFGELLRQPALEADLRFLYGPGWPDQIVASPATTTYRMRLRDVALGASTRFVAHHYTRYIGDLSGGQYLGPAIARAYGLDGDGHRFFVFPEVDPVSFKTCYRGLLDSLPWTRPEQDEFMAEVDRAYQLNIAMLHELKERWP
jgi:heme oxygenase